MISESQRLERLAERLRALDPATPSPASKIRAWNLVSAEIQKPASRRLQARSTGRLVLAGLAAAALLAIGTVAAAASSLPDSPLYPVKGGVEAVQGALAFSPADRFNYHLLLAKIRLREAEAMFARHRVDLAEQALASMEDQLSGASAQVKDARLADPAVADSLVAQLMQAIETHDNQLAGLQGQVTNPNAIKAITRARDRAQQALLAASADQGPAGQTASPSPRAHGSGAAANPSPTAKSSRKP